MPFSCWTESWAGGELASLGRMVSDFAWTKLNPGSCVAQGKCRQQ
jgi:hypothetical protein